MMPNTADVAPMWKSRLQDREIMRPSKLVEQFGGSYAKELGIDLSKCESSEIYKWFIAAILFGARISERIGVKTWREFEQAGLLSPHFMLNAGWDKLVAVLDHGGYVRYDFKTATKLLEINRSLLEQYAGDLNALHDCACNEADLEERLKRLSKGIGGVTVNIFLRELRSIWPKAASLSPGERTIRAAKVLGFIPQTMHDSTRILQTLKHAWRTDRMTAGSFVDFETALVRYEVVLRRISRSSS